MSRRRSIHGLMIGSVWLATLAFGSVAPAEDDTDLRGEPPIEIPRHVIATGGGRSAGGAWVVRGTLAQVDAEPLQPSTDGSGFYAITGGFWPALPTPQIDSLFMDGFEAQAE